MAGNMICPKIVRIRQSELTMTEAFHAHDFPLQIASPNMKKIGSVVSINAPNRYKRNVMRLDIVMK